ncbi:MAG: acetate uptake transporter [Thermoprotei archaeon]
MSSTPQKEWANPAVIGLMGFGMTTMLTGLNTAGYFPGGANLALAFIWGGTAQFLAGIIALHKGEIFAGSAFTGYGSFWIALFLINNIPALSTANLLGFWLMWTLFTLTFTINAPKHGPGITAVFVLLLLAYILLDAVSAGATSIAKAAGWEIFITGLVAWYVATAIEMNTNYGRKILPS